jgi:hypothetical protein
MSRFWWTRSELVSQDGRAVFWQEQAA